MGEPIQRVSGSLQYFIVSEVKLSLSLLKCIIVSPISAVSCQVLISHKDLYIVLCGQERVCIHVS